MSDMIHKSHSLIFPLLVFVTVLLVFMFIFQVFSYATRKADGQTVLIQYFEELEGKESK